MFAIFPEILHAAARQDQESLACLIRKYFAGNDVYAPRLRIEPLLGSLGVHSSREPVPYCARIQVMDHRGQYRISLSTSDRLTDTRELNYTQAHLLGYFLNVYLPLMAEAELSAEAYQLESSVLQKLLQRTKVDFAKVAAADLFALALLMPSGMVKKAYQALKSPENCAAFFHVPQALLNLRLAQLRVLPSELEASEDLAKPEVVPPSAASAKPAAQRASVTSESKPKSKAPEKASSLARVQQSVASRSYKNEGARVPASAATEKATQGAGDGLKRLRELAKKIDRSVDT